jgi:hypothetical protein
MNPWLLRIGAFYRQGPRAGIDKRTMPAVESLAMRRASVMQRFRRATWKTWLGAALAGWLLLAEAYAGTHQYDSAAHANGQACATCIGVASFGAGAVSAPVHFAPTIAASFVPVAAGIVFISVVPTRRYARGPPRASFTF